MLVDVTARDNYKGGVANFSESVAWVAEAVRQAAAAGDPFTKLGNRGLYNQRDKLPEPLRKLTGAAFRGLAVEALAKKKVIETVAVGRGFLLDVPGGVLTTLNGAKPNTNGKFIPEWERYEYDDTTGLISMVDPELSYNPGH